MQLAPPVVWLRLALLGIAVGIVASAARADEYYWTGDNASNGFSWNATTGLGGTNWSSSAGFNNGTSGLPGASDDVFFYFNPPPNLANLNTVLGQDFTIRTLTFTSDSTNTVTIGGTNTLTLGSGGLNVLQGAGTHVLNTRVALGAAQTWANNGTNPLAVNGVVSGTNNLTLAGGAGSGGFNFTAANTYTGSTTLSTAGAALTLSGATGSILTTSAVTLSGGSVLTLDNTAANNNARIAATLGITSGGGTLNLIGNAGTATAQTVGTLTLGSGLTNVNVTSGGAGATLTFGSASLPSFARPAAGGAVNFAPTGTIAAPNVTLTNNLIGGWATVGSVTGSAGTNVLDFATLTGGTVAPLPAYTTTGIATWTAADNVKVSNAQNPTATGATVNSVYMTGGGVLGVATTAYTLTVGSGGIISNAATGTYQVNGNFTMTNAALIGGGAFSGATANGNLNARLTVPAGVPDLVVTTASNLQINTVIGGANTAFGLTKNGSGILDIGGGNVDAITHLFTGSVNVNGGILLVRADTNFGAVPAAFTANSINLNGGEIRTTAGFAFAANRGITVGTSGGTLSYIGGATWTITQKITGPGNLTVASIPISTGGSSNTIALSNPTANANNYAGSTTLIVNQQTVAGFTQNNGNINWGANEQIPNTSALTLIQGLGPGTGVGRISLGTFTETVGSLAGNAPVVNFNGVFSTGGNNLSTEYSGSLTGSLNVTTGGAYTVGTAGTGSFTKTGLGTQTLSGINNYTGATSVNGGTLLIGSGTGTTSTASLANTTVTVGNGALVGALGGNGTINGPVVVTSTGHLSPAMTGTTTNTLTINNALTINGGATFDYNFGSAGGPGISDLINVTGTGSVTLAAGTDVLNVTALSGFGVGTYNLISVTGGGTLASSATFTVNGSNAFNYAVAVSGTNLVLTVTPGNPILTWVGNVNSTWQVGGPANWNNGTSAVAFANTNNVILDDTGIGTPTITVAAGGVSPNAVTVANSTGTYTLGGGAITVTNAITKTQAGNLRFNGPVTTGTTAIGGGKLTVGGAYNSTVKVDVTSGTLEVLGTLTTPAANVLTAGTLIGTGTVSGNATLTGNGVINFTAGGNITGTLGATGGNWNGVGTVTGAVTVGGGTFTVGSGATLTAPAGVTVTGGTLAAGGATSTITGGVTYASGVAGTFAGVIAGTGGGVTMNNAAGTFTLSDLNTYAGPTTVTAGVLSVSKIVIGGAASGVGASTSAATNLVLDGGTLRYTGPAASTDRNFTITGGATGTIDVTNALTITGASAATTGALTKAGAGTLILTGNNLHSGGTTVNAGTLLANTTTGSATGTGAVTVAAGGTLGGTGFVVPDTGSTGTNTISIAGVVSPGTVGTVGTLTFGSAAANATATLTGTYQFDLTGLGSITDPNLPANYGASSGTAVHDRLTVNGALAVAGSTVNVSNTTAAFTGTSGYSWLIASTTTGLTGTPALGTVGGNFAPFAAGFSFATTANNLYLNYIAQFVWTGNTSPAWATGSNWLPGTVPVSGNVAFFTSTSPNTTVSLGGVARPVGGIKFDTASAAAYTLGSAAGDALLFDANAAVTVTNTVTTAQTINANAQLLGALTVSNNGTGVLTFTGTTTLGTGGTAGLLTFTGTGTTVYGGTIAAGSVSGVVLAGPGTVTLTGTNAFAGGVSLNAGTLNVNSTAALGTGPFTIGGGTLNNTTAAAITSTTNNLVNLNANFGYGGTQPLNLGTGAVTQNNDATVTLAGTGGLTFGGSVTGGKNLTLAGTGTGTLTFNGASLAYSTVANTGAGTIFLGAGGGTTTIAGNLTSSAGGGIALSGTTTITGNIAVSGGTVTQADANTYQFSVNGAILQLNPGAVVTATGLSLASTGSTSGQILLGTGSTLSVNSPANITIGNNSGSTTNPVGAVVSGSGTAAVSWTAPGIVIGVGGGATGQRANVLVALGSGDNVLVANTAAGIAIGNSSNGGQDGDYSRGNNLGQVLVVLGKGNNTLTTPNLYISGTKSPGSLFLGNGPVAMTANGVAATPLTTSAYAPPVPFLKPGNTGYAQVTIGDAAGGKTAVIVGYQNVAASGTNSVGVFDTTGGILNGTFSTVTLGFSQGGGTSTHAGGVGSWVLGVANNNVTIDRVNMTNTAASTQGITGAVFSLNGGTVTFNPGGGGFAYGNTASVTNTNINLNGGTLDLNGNPILDPASSPLPLDTFGFNGGSLKNATVVFVTGGLTQAGGTLLRDQTGTTVIGTTATPGSDVYTVAGGATIRLNAATTNTVAVSAGSLARTAAGTLDIIPVTGNLSTAAAPTELVQFTASAPTLVAGEPILPAWIVARTNGTATASADFTIFDAGPNTSIARFTAYTTGSLNTATATDVANPNAATLLTTSPTVYALKLRNAVTSDFGTSGTSRTLTIGAAGSPSGLILDGGSIAANSLVFADEAVIHTTAQNGTITSPITAANGLTTFGPGRLTLGNTTANTVGAVTVNAGTLFLTGTTNASGPVVVRNGATLGGTGTIVVSGSNGVAFGAGGRFAPGNGTSGVFSLTTGSGNVTTATATTNPTALTSAGLTFGLGISPTNVVGSVVSLNLASPLATGAANSGLSNANTLGNRAGGFSVTSAGGTFVLDPITTVTVNATPANFTAGSSYSYLIGSVPTGSTGGVTNLGNFDFSNAGTSFIGSVSAATFAVSGGSVYLNFTMASPVPEPATVGLFAVVALGLGRLGGRRAAGGSARESTYGSEVKRTLSAPRGWPRATARSHS